jgi:AcrR family transcriptional regulator
MSPSPPDALDVRVERTRAALITAMSDLVREGGGKPISVSDLCRRAGVSRPTFYGHFRTTDDVLAAAIEERFARLGATPAGSGAAADPSEVFTAMLDELAGDRVVYGRALDGGEAYAHARLAIEAWLAARIGERFASTVDGAATAAERRRRTEFAAAGVITAVATWLRETRADEEAVVLSRDLQRLILRVLGTRGSAGDDDGRPAG